MADWGAVRRASGWAVGIVAGGATLLATGVLLDQRVQAPPYVFILLLYIGGVGLMVAGPVLGFLMYRHTGGADGPKLDVTVHVPNAAQPGRIEGKYMIYLPDVWLINHSRDHVILQFELTGPKFAMGMYPYRHIYRDRREQLKDVYLSNPRDLGPGENAEGHLAFVPQTPDEAEIVKATWDRQLTLHVREEHTGEKVIVPIPTTEGGYRWLTQDRADGI